MNAFQTGTSKRCTCYTTAQLKEGDGAHAPVAHPTCVGEASAEEAHEGLRISAI
jgi:hypothetical protein